MANAAPEAPGPPLTPKCGGTGGRGFLWGPQGRAWACQTPAEAQRGAPGRVVAEVFYLAGFAMPGAHEIHSRWPSEVDSNTLGPSPMVPLDNPTPHTAGGCGRKAPGIMLFHQQPNKNHPGKRSSTKENVQIGFGNTFDCVVKSVYLATSEPCLATSNRSFKTRWLHLFLSSKYVRGQKRVSITTSVLKPSLGAV